MRRYDAPPNVERLISQPVWRPTPLGAEGRYDDVGNPVLIGSGTIPAALNSGAYPSVPYRGGRRTVRLCRRTVSRGTAPAEPRTDCGGGNAPLNFVQGVLCAVAAAGSPFGRDAGCDNRCACRSCAAPRGCSYLGPLCPCRSSGWSTSRRAHP